jgi:lantibiotic modifying enzyme
MLVVGYRGTLRVASPSARGLPRSANGYEGFIENQPPIMERMLEPWLAKAWDQLTERTAPNVLIFRGAPVPLKSLLLLLKERLIDLLTQAVGAESIEHGSQSSQWSASDVLLKYPLLAPLLRSVVAEWVSATITFLRRLHQDQQWIAADLRLVELPPVESLSGTASDAHAGGHFVLRVCFVGGCCLYYKPRPVTGEWLWYGLLDAVTRVDPELRLSASRVLGDGSRLDYGWTSSVLPEDEALAWNCDERAKSDSAGTLGYWHAAGAMLCLAKRARLTDLHLGNIVATPWGPAVTDAECFATPDLPLLRGDKASPNHAAISDAAGSLVSTGLLPQRPASGYPDVSGLFGHTAPVSGVMLPKWVVSRDGRYRLVAVEAELVTHPNLLAQTSAIAVLPQILSGYRHAANLLLRARETLIRSGTQWLAVLEKVHAPRIVVRDTLTYGILLSQSLEPQYLRSRHRRRCAILSGLDTCSVVRQPFSLVRSEVRDLLEMHVPRLVVLPGTRTLAASSARRIARRFTACTPAQAVIRQIEELSRESIENVHVPALMSAIFVDLTSNAR